MSVEIMSKVWNLDLPSNEKFVLLRFADYADGDGANAFPSIDRVGYECGLSPRQTKRIVKSLRLKELLHLTSQYDRKNHKPNTYTVTTKQGDILTPWSESRVTYATGQGDICDMSRVTPMSPEPPLEPSVEPPLRKKSQLLPSVEATLLADALIKSIKTWRPEYLEITEAKEDETRKRWSKDLDLCIRRDKRDPEKIRKILYWLPGHGTGNGFKWREQILSGAKLRKQYDKLDMEYNKVKVETYDPTEGL